MLALTMESFNTKDGGKNWTKLAVDKLPGTPKSAFVNDIKADLHDKSTAYVVLDDLGLEITNRIFS